MATYLLPSDSSIADGAPVTQQLVQSLADNPTAIAQGAVGAPKFQEECRDNSGVGAGNYGVIELYVNSVTNDANSFLVKVIAAGIITFKINVNQYASSGQARVLLYNGASLVSSSANTTGSGQSQSVTGDTSVSAGDVLYIKMDEVSSLGSGGASAQGMLSISSQSTQFMGYLTAKPPSTL
jgi:hypothetical protein